MYTYRVPLEAEVACPYLGSEVHLTTKRNQVLKGLKLSRTKPFISKSLAHEEK